MDNKGIVSTNIQKFMERNGMQQVDLARALGISKTTVTHWISGRSVPRMDTLDQMCAVFHCTRSDLMDDKQKLTKSYELTNEEYMVLQGYRMSDDETRRMVFRILMAMRNKPGADYSVGGTVVETTRRKHEEP